jgi:ATP-binding cassette, subfamily B, bacterial MsbA
MIESQKSDMTSLSIYLRLLKYVKPYWFLLVIGIFGTLLASGIDATIVWVVKPLFDKGLVAKQHSFIVLLPAAIIIIFILRGAANFLSDYYITRVGRNVVMDFRQMVFNHMLKLPASFYDHQSSSKLISLIIYNVEQLASASTEAVLTVISEGGLALGLLIVMFILSWQLSLLFLIIAPIVAIVTHYTTRRLRKLSLNIQKTMADVTHIAGESIEGYRVVRTFGGENYEREKFAKATELNRQREIKTVITNSLGGSGIQIIAAVPIAVIMYFATSPFFSVTVGGFGAMIAAILRILTPLKRLAKINTTIQKGIAGAQTVFNLLDQGPETDTGIQTLDRAFGKIEYHQVSFSYSSTNPPKTVLDGISFVAKPGQVIALVGHSGSGKSTLVSLLPRFYDVKIGEILIDNINIQKYKLADLRKQFSFVSQEIILFNDTVANNIAYGKFSKVTKTEIIHAAKAAHIMHVIEQLPEGLNTIIGERGLLLSGGQRQRIAIARAILKDAPVLILDEATSALDTESERYLQEALKELMHRRTTLVIAHRLSTVERADSIIVLDQGKIVEQGTHKELIMRHGYYSKLYNMQFRDEVS